MMRTSEDYKTVLINAVELLNGDHLRFLAKIAAAFLAREGKTV